MRQKRWARRAPSSSAVAGQHAEVVEEVLAQLEVVELVGGDDEQQRAAAGTSRVRTSRQRAKAPSGSVVGADDGARPSRPRARRSAACSGRATAFHG